MASATQTASPTGELARRYAGALYSLAEERGALDESVDQMESLGRLIDESADFRRFAASPLVDVAHARGAADAVLAQQGFGKTVRDFVGVIANNRRLPALRNIAASFAALAAEKRGVVVAAVTSAHPLTTVQRESLRARLIEAGYGSVDIQDTVDPSILGGLVVRVGARLYDTSLKSRLQRLQYAMKGAA